MSTMETDVGDGGKVDPDLRCDYCQLTADRPSRPREQLLVCFSCMAKAHPSCMDYSEELAARTRRSPWQCIDCKTCAVCGDADDADAMLFCDACDKGYHMACHDPKVPEKPNGKWICRRCQQENERDEREADADAASFERDTKLDLGMNGSGGGGSYRCTVDGTPGLPTPCQSPALDSGVQLSKYVTNSQPEVLRKNPSSHGGGGGGSGGGSGDVTHDLDVPDASEWSIEDTENYFSSIGFLEQSKAFVEQEIDGRSLLLLKRNDVLSGLGLKLGPALKIYNHVQRLQTKSESVQQQQQSKN